MKCVLGEIFFKSIILKIVLKPQIFHQIPTIFYFRLDKSFKKILLIFGLSIENILVF